MRHRRFLPFVILGAAAVGCGNQDQPSRIAPSAHVQQMLQADADVITDAAFEVVIAEEEYADRSNAPECLALRGEINVLRPALLAKTEWLSLIKTQAWQALKHDYEAYTDAQCPPVTLPATEITESCSTARASLIQAWTMVQASPEYQVVDKHDALNTLVDKWTRAKAANCIAQ